MSRTYTDVRKRMSPELRAQGMSALRCPHCHEHFRRRQETHLLKEYWGKCLNCRREVDTDVTELSVLPDYHQFFVKKNIFDRVWYHATDKENWYEQVEQSSTMIYVPGQGPVRRDRDHRIFVHLGSKESAERRSKDLGGLPYMYKVMLLPGQVANKMFSDINWWPDWYRENDQFNEFCEINRYVNRYEVPGSISLLTAYGSFRVVERVKKSK